MTSPTSVLNRPMIGSASAPLRWINRITSPQRMVQGRVRLTTIMSTMRPMYSTM